MRQKWRVLNDSPRGVVAGLLSALCVSGYVIINKHVYQKYAVDPLAYAVLFAAGAAIWALPAVVLRVRGDVWKRVKSDAGKFIVLGVVGAVAMAIITIGQRYTSSINASFLFTLSMVTTLLFSRLILSESPTKRQLLWIIGLFAGLYLAIVGLETLHLKKGDLIVLSSMFFFGFGNVYSRKVMKTHGNIIVPDIRLVLGGVFAAILALLVLPGKSVPAPVYVWALTAGLVLWLTMRFFATSVHLINANHAIVLNQTQIVSTSILGVLLLGEQYGWERALGTIVALVSIYCITLRSRS